MTNVVQDLAEWRDLTVDDLTKGLNTDNDSELIDKGQLTNAENAIMTWGRLERDTGYVAQGAAVRGDPRRVFEYLNPLTNTTVTLLVTDLTCYVWQAAASQWQYTAGTAETTVNANHTTGNTAITVTSITGFSNGDFVGVVLDNGQMHMTTVNGAPAGTTITLAVGLPSAASIGRAFVRAPILAGSPSFHVTGVQIPWDDKLIFTNVLDNVKQFDPSVGARGTVITMTGTGLDSATRCNSLALFDNSLILAGVFNGVGLFGSRIQYCAKGDITLWNTLEAGAADYLDSFGEIRQALPLGPYLVLYRRKGITRLSIGGTSRFIADPVSPGVMIDSSLGAADVIDKHIVWGKDKIFWYRGGLSVEEVECSIRDSIFGNSGDIKQGGIASGGVFTVPLLYRNEVIFAYGAQVSGRTYPRYHLDNGTWTRRKFGAGGHRISGFGTRHTIQGGSQFLCESTGDIVYLYDLAANADGAAALTLTVETKDFSHPDYLLRHDYLDIGIVGGNNVTVEYSTNKGATWTSLGTAIANANTRLFKQFVSKYIRYRFTCSNACSIRFFNMRYKYEAQW